jgi:streptomycin 6-kinase
VPADLARTVSGYGGARGAAWLSSLPAVVSSLASAWGLEVGEPYQPSGVTALVLRAWRDGAPCVLKVRFPEPDSAGEAAALRAYGGGAAVALLESDEARTALLLERCEPGGALFAEQSEDVRASVVADLLAELWVPVVPGLSSLAETGERWLARIGAAAAFDAALRSEACGVLRDLLASPGEQVLLHGDLHAGNVLAATRRPWLAIDPKGEAGERAYDCAALLRDRATPSGVPRRLAILTERLGLDPARVRGWALAQAVEGAVGCYECGDVAGGDAFAEAARIIAALPY